MGRVAEAMMLVVGSYLFLQWRSPLSSAMALLIKVLFFGPFPILLWKASLLSQAEIGTLHSIRDSPRTSRWFGLAPRKAASV